MSLDSRGVRRGGCSECTCTGYDGGIEMKKCIRCLHPPGKHKNLSSGNAGSAAGSTSYASTAQSHANTTHNDFGGGFYSNPVTTMNHRDYSAGGSVHSYNQPPHVQYHHYQPRPQLQLPPCQANDCFNVVHYDPSLPEGLRVFAYCSPQCRDRHLLPIEKVNLTVDLGNMKKKLQEVAVAEKRSPSSSVLRRQLSSEYSSRPAGSSSFPGAGRVLGGSSSGSNAMHSSSSTPAGGGRSFGGSSISDHASGVSSSSTAIGGSRVVGTSDKKAKEQQTSVLSVKKPAYEPFGVLLRKTPYTSDKTYGFLIVGAIRGSPAHILLQNGKLKIFDVITHVSGKSCSEVLVLGKDPQMCFDQCLKDHVSVNLHLSHSISLPPISDLLNKAQRYYTHLIALKYSSDYTEQAFGLTLSSGGYNNDRILVGGRTAGTPAGKSGLEFKDEVRMYAEASVDTIGDVKEVIDCDNGVLFKKFDEAQRAKKNIILMIWRPRV